MCMYVCLVVNGARASQPVFGDLVDSQQQISRQVVCTVYVLFYTRIGVGTAVAVHLTKIVFFSNSVPFRSTRNLFPPARVVVKSRARV